MENEVNIKKDEEAVRYEEENTNEAQERQREEKKDEQKEEQTKMLRISPAIRRQIEKYRATHPECRSDTAAVDAIFLPMIEKEVAVGEDEKVAKRMELFMEHWDAGKSIFLASLSAYRTLKEDEENRHGGVRDELAKELKDVSDELAKCTKDREKDAARIVDLADQIEKLQNENQQKQGVIDGLLTREDPVPLHKELNDKNAILNRVQVDLAETRKDRDALKKEVERVVPENAALIKERDELAKKKEELEAQYMQTKDELFEVKGNLKEARKEVENAVAQTERTEKELTKEQLKTSSLEENNAALQKQNAELKETLAVSREQIKTVQIESYARGKEEGRKEFSEIPDKQ